MDEATVTIGCPSSSHQISLALQYEVGECVRTSIELSHPPTPPNLDNIYTDLSCKPICYHVDLLPTPTSPCFVDPLDCNILRLFIPDSTLVVN